MPGHVVTVAMERRWRRRGQFHAVGEVREPHVDVSALGLPRLGIELRGQLDGTTSGIEEPDPLRTLKAKVNAEPRSTYEMQQILPGLPDEDLILAAIERNEEDDPAGAARLLLNLVTRDLRCIDAHAHLGNLVFPYYAEHARLHYEIGVAIGDHALGPEFRGVLPWSYVDNRPFLRCLHGLGLSLWRLERMEEAACVFERLLWLNPSDEQRAGRCWVDVKAGRAWDD